MTSVCHELMIEKLVFLLSLHKYTIMRKQRATLIKFPSSTNKFTHARINARSDYSTCQSFQRNSRVKWSMWSQLKAMLRFTVIDSLAEGHTRVGIKSFADKLVAIFSSRQLRLIFHWSAAVSWHHSLLAKASDCSLLYLLGLNASII